APAMLEELREADRLMTGLSVDADKVLRDADSPEEPIECLLQVRLLASRKCARCGLHFVHALRSKMARESLEGVPVGVLSLLVILSGSGCDQRDASLHTLIADEAGVSRNYLSDIALRPVAKLAAPP